MSERKRRGQKRRNQNQSVPETDGKSGMDQTSNSSETMYPQNTQMGPRFPTVSLRRWELKLPEECDSGVEFTVVSYNVLAQDLIGLNMAMYEHCQPWCLAWQWRWQLLMEEFRQMDAEILCLQEVQENHYESFYEPFFSDLGYHGVYKKRTGDKQDGCATFYKTSRFTMDKCVPLEYYRPGVATLDRDNIALIVMLTVKACKRQICVANTHLLFNEGRGDVKLCQTMLLLTEIDRLAFRSIDSEGIHYCPVILCGDLNSRPYYPLYDFICSGKLVYKGMMAGNISGQTQSRGRFPLHSDILPTHLGISDQCQYVDIICDLEDVKHKGDDTVNNKARDHLVDSYPVTFSSGEISHKFNFRSAYDYRLSRVHGMPAVTSCCTKISNFGSRPDLHAVDYIFYSGNSSESSVNAREPSLKLVATFGLLSRNEAFAEGGLPSAQRPSDHFALLARFSLGFATKTETVKVK